MSRVGFLFAVLMAGCGGADSDRLHHRPGPDRQVGDFRTGLEDQGYAVQDGLLFYSTYDQCCDPGGQCWGNNPATPYGTWAVPASPGEEPAEDVFEGWGKLPVEGLTRSFHLRPDEAIVQIGTTPPAAKYFSARSYVIHRFDEGLRRPLFGSLGPSMNHLTLATARGVDPAEVFSAPLVLLTTADLAVERVIREALVAAGFDESTIHNDRITHHLTQMGLHDEADTFNLTWRVAVDENAFEGGAYRADPLASVLRITPPGPETVVEPHGTPQLPSRGTDVTEGPWADALAELDAAILAEYADYGHIRNTAIPVFQPTLECFDLLNSCGADLTDRLVTVIDYFRMDSDDFVVVFGVNHEASGKASYSNVAVISDEHEMGIVGVDSREMLGSARHWLPDHPQAEDLFAYVLRRSCDGRPEPCAEIPEGCPGCDLEDRMRVTFRAYLEPATQAAPVATELLPDTAIKFYVR